MTTVHHQRVEVSYEYPVYFTTDVCDPNNPHFAQVISHKEPQRRHRLFVVIDRGVASAWPQLAETVARYVDRCPEQMALLGHPVIVEGGEAIKNDPASVPDLQARFNALGMDRQSFVVVIGGGAVQDMVGYAAATAHRGMRVVRVPTTVLSQSDSGVGVKNGVNAFGKKNGLGTFAPPFAVLNDRRFLETLSPRDTIAGMAEAVKVAVIRDASFFEWLEEHVNGLAAREPEAVADLIHRCAHFHLTHIATSGDPFEFGSARPLDFGHWAAHKLESLGEYRLRHGEAVAIGIALDTWYSVAIGLLKEPAFERIIAVFDRLGFRLWDDALDRVGPDGRPTVLDGLAEFREHLGGELTVTLLEDIGRAAEVHEIRDEVVMRGIGWLREHRRA